MFLTSLMRRLRREERGAAMITAILLAVVLLALAALTTAITVRGTQNTVETKNNIYFAQAADAAIADAIMKANQSGEKDFFEDLLENEKELPIPPGCGWLNKQAGQTADKEFQSTCDSDFKVDTDGIPVKSSWYVHKHGVDPNGEPIDPDNPESVYLELFAIGYHEHPSEENAVAIRVRIEGLNTSGMARNEAGEVVYRDRDFEGIAERGFIGSDYISAKINDETLVPETNVYPRVQEFDSSAAVFEPTPFKGSRTNGYVTTPFYPPPPADKPFMESVIFHNAKGFGTLTEEEKQVKFLEELKKRCYTQDPAGNEYCHISDLSNVPFISYEYQINNFAQERADACASAPSVTPWVASSRGTVLTGNASSEKALCVSELTIDENVTVDPQYTADAPLTIYVTGNTVINPSRTLGPTSGPIQEASASLRIVSSGTVLDIGKGSNDATVVAAQIVAPKAECSIANGNEEEVRLYGSIACKSLTLHNKTRLFFDNQVTEEAEDDIYSWRSTTYKNMLFSQVSNYWPTLED